MTPEKQNRPFNRELARVRLAGSKDADLLYKLARDTFVETYASVNTAEDLEAYLRSNFSPQIQAAELESLANHYLILELEGEASGYARLRAGRKPDCVVAGTVLELVRFYLRKAWQGSGAATPLMEACLDLARAKGCAAVWLDVWDQNPRAIAFYRKWGFEVAGSEEFILGSQHQTDLVMVRRLD